MPPMALPEFPKKEGLRVCDHMGMGGRDYPEAAFGGQMHYFYVKSVFIWQWLKAVFT